MTITLNNNVSSSGIMESHCPATKGLPTIYSKKQTNIVFGLERYFEKIIIIIIWAALTELCWSLNFVCECVIFTVLIQMTQLIVCCPLFITNKPAGADGNVTHRSLCARDIWVMGIWEAKGGSKSKKENTEILESYPLFELYMSKCKLQPNH